MNKTDFKYNIGDIITNKYGKLLILDKIYKQSKYGRRKYYKVKCLVCPYEFDISEHHLKEGCGCSVCTHHKVLKGYNDMWTTNPEMAELLFDPEDGYKYAAQSNKKLDWICQDCGEIIRNVSPNTVYRQGLSCKKCGDGISYPNKYMYNILKQLKEGFEPEKLFDWCKFKEYNSDKDTYGIYDFVIESKKLIIEMDGGLNHGDSQYCFGNGVEELLHRDRQKGLLAGKHGYKVIRVKCVYNRISDRENVCRNAVLESELKYIYDLNNIDFDLVNKEALSSTVLKICDMYNDGLSAYEISEETKLSHAAVLAYLKQGTKAGLCDYQSPMKFNKQYLINNGYTDIKTREDLNNAKLDYICKYYNSHPGQSYLDIANMLNIGDVTVWKYLKQGAELGLCNYISGLTKFKPKYFD